jgi:hypothetical protein
MYSRRADWRDAAANEHHEAGQQQSPLVKQKQIDNHLFQAGPPLYVWDYIRAVENAGSTQGGSLTVFS